MYSLLDTQEIMMDPQDRKSTRLNSSHPSTSYDVFCLKKIMALLVTDHLLDVVARPARGLHRIAAKAQLTLSDLKPCLSCCLIHRPMMPVADLLDLPGD